MMKNIHNNNGKLKKSVGRPSGFDNLNFIQLKALVLSGATDVQIAKFFNITRQTLENYKKNYHEFFYTLKDWKLKADAKVERSLYEKACGYSAPAVKFFQHGNKIIKQEYIEHYPPDTVACIFWLKNRQPEQWREKVDYEHTGELTIKFKIENASGFLNPTEVQSVASPARN